MHLTGTAPLLAVALLASSVSLLGQSTEPTDQTQLVRTLIDRIDGLEKRLSELETKSPPPPVIASDREKIEPGEPKQLQAAHAHNVAPVPEIAESYPLLKIAGFTDVNFAATDQPGTRSGFSEGQFILHMTSALSPKVAFFGELSFTARSDAGVGTPAAAGFNAELERAIIRYDHSDRVKFSFGRYHTPVNYWNNTFHHGSWLQTTISRPEMTQFGGSFIPVHFVGSLVEGNVPAGGLNLNYNVGVGNGRGSIISRGGDFGDVNNHRASVLNVFARPDRFYGLQVGASFYRDKISPATGREARESIQSAHIAWQKENPEIIAEFANITHRDLNGATRANSQAWYVQTAYRLPAFEKAWKPYYRFEYMHIPASDWIFRNLRSSTGSTFGVRYDLSSFAALKFEYRRHRRLPVGRVDGAFLQTSFTF